MAHIYGNFSKFFSKLNNFRDIGRYTDVTIECDDRSFQCHRLALAAACDYFDAMFGGNFKESTAESIVLEDIKDAAVVEEVLRFIYTGDAGITSDNVYSLLRASDILGLKGFEDLCVQFIQKNMPVKNILKLLLFACLTNKSFLIDILIEYVIEYFELLSKSIEFVEIPFDILCIILTRCKSSVFDDVTVNAIIRWIRHSREDRLQYFDEFAQIVRFENVSSTYMKFIVKRFIETVDDYDTNELIDFDRHKPSLHVYLKYPEENLMRVFSINNPYDCSTLCQIPQPSTQGMRSIAVDNTHLYCLNYCRDITEVSFQQKFCAYTSVDLSSELTLRPPPVLLSEFNMCEMQNYGIFFYDEYLSRNKRRITSPNLTSFSEDEINRGVYLYNRQLDNWFSVPRMKRKVHVAAMTVCDSTLYLIGGERVVRNIMYSGQDVQAYDYRVGEWRELRKTTNMYSKASCCAYKGKIYVCGGVHSTRKDAEVYDPVAGKWDRITPMNTGQANHKIIPYANGLWAMGGHVDDTSTENLSIDVYDPKSNEWNVSRVLIESSKGIQPPSIISDAVVFKSL